MSSESEDLDPKEQPLVAHLIELRDRILRCLIAVIVVFVAIYAWANDIYMFVSAPLTSLLDLEAGERMIATDPTSSFFAPFKLTFMVAVFICIPYILHQAWAFIAPGLYRNEIRVTFPILVSSIVLFYVGVSFAYFLVFDFLFGFFVAAAPDNVAVMTDINLYLSFVLRMFMVFGIVFEIPIATVLLILTGVTTSKALAKKRGYVVIACFAIAIPLTPADPFSQSILAIPMWMLFELGLFASRLIHKPEEDVEAAEAAESE
jgi:sec-independent protein translocase protein TatC